MSNVKKYLITICLWIVLPLTIIFLYIGIPTYINKISHVHPNPNDDPNPSNKIFSEKRVIDQLKYVVEKIGSRVRFSVGNVKFVEWLKNEIEEMKKDQEKQRKEKEGLFVIEMEMYEQGFLSSEENGMLYNIAVKVTSQDVVSEKALLISAHFDTVLYSPGGSDDGVNCMIMLELLRNIVNRDDDKLYYPIIFVWVNDEENGFYGAEAFSEYFLYENVERFINLESTGRGMSMIYELEPYSIQKEINSIPKIHINSFGIEISELRIFAGTDYYVYSRDKKGLESAFFQYGFYYHTQYDDMNNVDKGTVQYLGDGIFNIIQKYCYNEKSPLVKEYVNEKSKYIFYDYLRYFQIGYSQTTNVFFSFLFALWSFIFPIWGIIIKICLVRKYKKKGIKEKSLLTETIVSDVFLNLIYFFGYCFSAIFGVVSAILFGLISSIKSVYTINTQFGFSVFTFTIGTIIGILIPQAIVSFFVFFCFSKRVTKFIKLRYQAMNFFIGIFIVILSFLPVRFYLFYFVSLNFNLFLTVVYFCETLILIVLSCKGESIPDYYFWSSKESYLLKKIFVKKKDKKKGVLENDEKFENENQILLSNKEETDEMEVSINGVNASRDINDLDTFIDSNKYKRLLRRFFYFVFSNKLIYIIFPLIIIIPLLNDIDFVMTILSTFLPIFLRLNTLYVSPAIVIAGICGLLGIIICFPFLPNLHIARNFCKFIFVLIVVSFILVLILAGGKSYSKYAPRLLELYSKEMISMKFDHLKNELVEINGEYEFDVYSVDIYGINENDDFFSFAFDDGAIPRNIECENQYCKFKMDDNTLPLKKDFVFKQVGNNTYMFHFLFNETIFSKVTFFGEKDVDYKVLNMTGDYIIHQEIYEDTFYTNNYVVGNTSSLIREWKGFVKFLHYPDIMSPILTVEKHYCNYQTDFPEIKNMMNARREFAFFRWGGSCVISPYYNHVLKIYFA